MHRPGALHGRERLGLSFGVQVLAGRRHRQVGQLVAVPVDADSPAGYNKIMLNRLMDEKYNSKMFFCKLRVVIEIVKKINRRSLYLQFVAF